MTDPSPPTKTSNAAGRWALIAALVLLLLPAGYFAYQGLTVGDVDMPATGYLAMGLGIVFSLAIGIGLMALVFYSSRKGYDERATWTDGRDSHDPIE
ncbi:hypothetical protein [Rhodopseudomonas sp. B29]|uniref:hypothetical protein n=1 Tax=Rhodopseudomonas sp. B29 TaxID=95607 RepID=UPI00034CA869|nr:hypothetical protein [Rhodopseudomonas sp. B29]